MCKMLLTNLKSFFRSMVPTGVVLLMSCSFYFLGLEMFLLACGSTGRNLLEYLQPPYKEKVTDYVVGERNQTRDNFTIANQLYGKIRVHCLVHLTNDHERRKAKHIERTWGARCNRMHFSTESNVEHAYRRIHSTFQMDLDWLLHVHVDSYVIMENLRFTLSSYPPSQPFYFSANHSFFAYAHVSQKDSTDYIFSRAALQQILARNCLPSHLAVCLADMIRGPSEQLYPFHVPAEIIPFSLRSEFWNWPFIHRAVYSDQGFDQSVVPIAFPYTTANQFYVLEYMLYHLRPYGHMSEMPALRSGSAVEVPALPVNDTLARRLYDEVRILCMVLSYPHKHEKVARSIRKTWGRRCNKLIVFSSQKQKSYSGVHTVALNVSEGYALLWGKTKAAFRHVYRHHQHEADWFFKADDDTYAIIDNMRYMLHTHQPDEPIYFGCNFYPAVNEGYMSGGAGYVISREGLRRLVEHGIYSKICNRMDSGTEDFEMGMCLRKTNVTAGDSRDTHGRHRFLPLTLEHFLIPGRMYKNFWLYRYMYYKLKEGLECCSTYAITIHYVQYYQMYLFDFLLYKMRPYGIISGHESLRLCPSGNESSVTTQELQGTSKANIHLFQFTAHHKYGAFNTIQNKLIKG